MQRVTTKIWQAMIPKAVLGAAVSIALGAAVLLGGCAGQGQAQNQGQGEDAPGIEVTMTVDASAAVQEGWNCEEFLFQDTLTIPEGGTALDALDASGLVYDATGGYVSSIEGLAELSLGDTSGWTYTVNGEWPTDAVDTCTLHAGDELLFCYITSWEQ